MLSSRSALALPGAGVFVPFAACKGAGSSQTNTAGSTSGGGVDLKLNDLDLDVMSHRVVRADAANDPAAIEESAIDILQEFFNPDVSPSPAFRSAHYREKAGGVIV